jgi:catechol 2,3-dioxygenase-like lactoylglutathione lyase family enzyme
MFLTGIDHVQLAAPPGCEHGARNFFGRLLGLEEIEKPEALRLRGGCWFKVGDQQLHIGVEKDFRPAQKAHPAFSVENIEVLFTVLAEAGIRCRWDDMLPGGIKRFYADDPWGNRLEFTEPTF